MTDSIVFLDVDPEDEMSVREHYPDAVIHGHSDGEDVIDLCRDAAVVSLFVQTSFSKDIIEQLPNLKLLCTRSVGYDHIDVEACRTRGVTVCHVPDYGSHVIAEHVFALLLSTFRHVSEADKRVESGTFDYRGLRGIALRGKTMGVVGTGRIGRRTAEIALGFGMRVLAVDLCRIIELEQAGVEYVGWDQLLEESDIISLHVPATPETYHLLNAEAFGSMKSGVCIVNTARGELIDSIALLKALNDGTVRYALLDVLEHEKNFEENKSLIEHPHVISTPHIAFYAEESMRNMYDDCFASIDQWLTGTMPEHTVQSPTVVCDLPGISGSQ